MQPHPFWIVAVNEDASRFILRTVGTFVEFVDYSDSGDFLEHEDDRPSDLCRTGNRVMLKSRTRKHEELLRVFLNRVAHQIDEAVRKYPARGLVVCAPPRVLNALRDLMSGSSRRLLIHESTEDLVREPIETVRQVLAGEGTLSA